MPDICVVHLVRKKNGIEPFRSFLASYLENSAGIDHELLVLYKGFSQKGDITSYEKLLRNIPHSTLRVPDFGFDLRYYFMVAKKYNRKYYCFLNSFSLILDNDWLLKLYHHISKPGVGLVGATGSWLGTGPVLPILKKNKDTTLMHMGRLLYKIPRRYFIRYLFPRQPNYHIRTNGFMIMRDTMLKIHRGMLLTKIQAYLLESGKYGITRQIEKMGLRPLVVGKDGKGYKKNEWNISNTFWQGTQGNLMISDNQTRKYDVAGPGVEAETGDGCLGKLRKGIL